MMFFILLSQKQTAQFGSSLAPHSKPAHHRGAPSHTQRAELRRVVCHGMTEEFTIVHCILR